MKYLFLFFLTIQPLKADEICQYSYTVWNTRTKKSEGPFRITKPRIALSKTELREGCSVCESDQTELKLSNNLVFKVCKKEAGKIHSVLEKFLKSGGVIKTLVGYRPSMSAGPVDSLGRRTEFSRHAFGVAVDVNEDHNGLYDQCIQWGPSCRLIKGGKYSESDPLSLQENSVLVRYFRNVGFQWGGIIHGYQKDFMHFSPDGL